VVRPLQRFAGQIMSCLPEVPTMPYDKISDLPKAQVDQYDSHQKKAFLEAFNSAEDEYHNEHQAFAVAHSAAKKAGEKEKRDAK
jgi:cation transport regulator